MSIQLILAVAAGVFVLLFLILKLRFQAFLALLIVAILIGALSGMEPQTIFKTVKDGMGGTLGFVATVVGLGALFGALLEHSGGATALAHSLLKTFGLSRAPHAILLTGFLIAIPVFFDVAFIILMPVVHALQKKTGKSILYYAIPLLAGLAITHTFVPPTPGPIAVADILGAPLGWVIVFGLIVGFPTAILAGPVFGKYIANKIDIKLIDATISDYEEVKNPPSIVSIFTIILLPILFIVSQTVYTALLGEAAKTDTSILGYIINLIGHPFSALIIANIVAWYWLGIRRKVSKEELFDTASKSLLPAGVIILLTGAGGALKQTLIETGIGKQLAETMNPDFFPPVVLGFIIAVLVRLLQGSATVAMITAAGITAPLLLENSLDNPHKAILVISIASGASILSHVNDSGFWLVKEFLGMTEKETFRSWSMMTSIIAVSGFLMSLFLWYVI